MATYYISTTGSDGAAGTLIAPWATFAHADGVITAGDTVRVLPGTYTFTASAATFDDLDTHPSGTAGARIQWISDTPLAAKLVSSGATGGGAYVLWRAKGSYTDIIGFDLSATSANVNMSYLLGVEGSNCTVQNCVCHDAQLGACSSGQGGAGIYSGNSTFSNVNVDIIGCKAYNIGATGCLYNHGIYSTIQGGTIANNICYGNGGWGIHYFHNAGAGNCYNNLCFNNGHGGIQVASSGINGYATIDHMVVANNICCYNLGGNGGISDNLGGSNNVYFNNDSYGNATGNYIIAAGTISGNLQVNPQFINYQTDGSGDYHLSATSPCIDAGVPIVTPALDYDGNPRPQGAGYDIGPYEFITPLSPLIEWRASSSPFAVLTSLPLLGSGSSGTIPLGTTSFPVTLRVYNNFAASLGVSDALNCLLSVYDDPSREGLAITPAALGQYCQVQVANYNGVTTSADTLYVPIGGQTKHPVPTNSGTISGSGSNYITILVQIAVPVNATQSAITLGLWVEYSTTS